jgi:hypothetical protein
MKKIDLPDRQPGAARAFMDKQLAAGRVAFPLESLTDETGLSATAANNQLRRLGSMVARVSRPQAFFLIVTPEHRAFGAPPVAWWLDDYFGWLGHAYYLALQSAAGTYGSEPQALQVAQVMTDRPRREIKVGRLRIRFFVKGSIGRTPTRSPSNAYAPLRVSTPEATAFDLIRYESRIGGIGRAIETLMPLLPLIRSDDLIRALDAENEPTIAQRLGYILEKTGWENLAGAVRRWLPSRLALVPLTSSKGHPPPERAARDWRVLDGSGEFEP